MTHAETPRSLDAFVTSFVERLRAVTGHEHEFVALHEPAFGGNEWAMVKQCLDTGWVSSAGEFVDQFEAELAARCGSQYCVAVTNGTAALHLALIVSGVLPGNEVIVPALTFVATANAVSHAGAVPHFVDSDWDTLGLDPASLKLHLDQIAERKDGVTINIKTGRRLAAIMPMHTFGHPVNMDHLLAIAREFGIDVVEDAAEALGSLYKGRPVGSLGQLGVLSFNGNKIITTGGGGAILTDDSELAARAKHLSTTAKVPHRWAFNHDDVGFNYRMPNINAALGCAQLEQLDGFLSNKRALAGRYIEGFADFTGLSVFQEPELSTSNYWLNAMILEEAYAGYRDVLLDASNEAGLMCRPAWTLMHRLPMYQDAPCATLPVATEIAARLINIPSSAGLGAN